MTSVPVSTPVLRWAQRRSGRDDAEFVKKFSNWERWLSRERIPALPDVEKLAEFTHVPVGYLLLPEFPEEPLSIPDFRVGRGPRSAPSDDLLDTIYLNQRRQQWYEDYLTPPTASESSNVTSALPLR